MRTLLLCLDGTPHGLLASFMSKGLVPNLARVASEGVFGPLESVYPPVTAPAFASILTGQPPTQHGVLHFKTDPLDVYGRNIDNAREEGAPEFVTSSAIRGMTFLDQMSIAGLSLGTIGVPLTYPPWDVGGFMICGFLTPPSATDWAIPRSLKAQVEAWMPDYLLDLMWQIDSRAEAMRKAGVVGSETQGWWDELRLGGEANRLFAQAAKVTQQRIDLALRLKDLYDPDLMMAYFRPTDVIQHYFLHRDDVMARFYSDLDRGLGRLLDAAGPEANVFVISDHGFRLIPRRAFNTNAWLASEGYLRTKTGLLDRAYRAAYLAGRSIKGRMKPRKKGRHAGPGKLSRKLISKGKAPVDWGKTVAYGVGGGICINEGSGRSAELAHEIKHRLSQLQDPETSRKVAERVVLREEAFTGPFVRKLPHIVLDLTSGLSASLELGGEVFSWVPPGERSGTHDMIGILLARGPDISSGVRVENARLLDLAPTILHLHGLGIPPTMAGRALPIFKPGSRPAETEPSIARLGGLSGKEKLKIGELRKHLPKRGMR